MKKINLLDKGYFHENSNNDCRQGYARVRLNTNKFIISFKNTYLGGYYPHVGITAQSGLAMHFKKNFWYPYDCFKNLEGKAYNVDLSPYISNDIDYEFFISSPIIGGMENLEIILPDNCNCHPVDSNCTILFLGGPITHGLGLTSAGNMLANMTARYLGCNIRQRSFEDNDFLARIAIFVEGAFLQEKIDVVCVELDHARQSRNSIQQIFNILNWIERKNAKVIVWNCTAKKSKQKVDIYRNLGCIINDFSYLYENPYYADICTLSSNFLNDSGRYYIFKELRKSLDANI